jgi:hypothetical protein
MQFIVIPTRITISKFAIEPRNVSIAHCETEDNPTDISRNANKTVLATPFIKYRRQITIKIKINYYIWKRDFIPTTARG